jgi:hypothetical protein
MVKETMTDAAAEVHALFERYERALVDGDAEVMNSMFWASPDVVRYGIADAQRGADELVRWRAAQGPLPPGRALHDTVVSTVGPDLVIVSTCFTYPGRALLGRQSQTWARLDDGWRIVSAHVSEIPAPP